MVLSPPIPWKSTWPRSQSLVTLLLIYFVTRKRCLHLHDDALGTAAHGVPYVSLFGTTATLASLCLARRYNSLVHVSLPSLAGAFFSRVFSYPYHLSQGRHSMFLRPGPDLRSSLHPKKAASVLFSVKLIYPACVSSSCAMVVMCTGAFIVFYPAEESPQTSIHSSTNTFLNVSPVGIQFAYNRPSETFFPLPWGSQVLVWHHCHHVLARSSTRQSRP